MLGQESGTDAREFETGTWLQPADARRGRAGTFEAVMFGLAVDSVCLPHPDCFYFYGSDVRCQLLNVTDCTVHVQEPKYYTPCHGVEYKSASSTQWN